MTARQHRESRRRALQSARDARKRTGRKGLRRRFWDAVDRALFSGSLIEHDEALR